MEKLIKQFDNKFPVYKDENGNIVESTFNKSLVEKL